MSQYYRVSVDMARPYNVYGGLQDNGSWMGPSETYRQSGMLNSDWTRLGGGDGFVNLVDTTNNFIVDTESQYLGLSRVNMRTGERTTIRPGDPIGHIGGRRNWETWREVGVNEDERLGNAMAPANWDGPLIISPHDASALYAGTNILWKTTDRGDSWHELGDLTTGTWTGAPSRSWGKCRTTSPLPWMTAIPVLAHHLGGGGESAEGGVAVRRFR